MKNERVTPVSLAFLYTALSVVGTRIRVVGKLLADSLQTHHTGGIL